MADVLGLGMRWCGQRGQRNWQLAEEAWWLHLRALHSLRAETTPERAESDRLIEHASCSRAFDASALHAGSPPVAEALRCSVFEDQPPALMPPKPPLMLPPPPRFVLPLMKLVLSTVLLAP